MADVRGSYEPRFSQVAEMLATNLDSGADVGASVAVFLDGEPVVDIWGGVIDVETGATWQRDTIINVWSITKTMTALCALVLADRGELDFSAPVTKYWPEFASGGKERIEVRHLMSHSAGLSGWTEPMAREDLYDWEKSTSLLAAQEPWWEPGTRSGYHAVTQGYLVGEVIRRITGKTVGHFFADEVAGPLGADFHIGTPPEADGRVAKVIPPDSLPPLNQLDRKAIPLRTLLNPPLDAASSWSVPWRRAEIPAAGGHGNARSVAAVQSMLANGGEARGVRLLSAAGCEAVLQPQVEGEDLVLGMPIRFGLGYGLASETMPIGDRACYWGGWGGSVIFVDMDMHLAVSYVMNRMESQLIGDMRGVGFVLAAVAAVGASSS